MKIFVVVCLLAISSAWCKPAGYYGGSGGAYSAQLGGSGGAHSAQLGTGAGAGAGQQYNNRYTDGSYDFGYQTGSGAFQSERRTAGGAVTGQYGTSGPDGTYTNVQYQGQSTGGDGGYARLSGEKYRASFAGPAAASAPLRQAYAAPAAAQRYVAPAAPQRYTAPAAPFRQAYVAPAAQRYTASNKPAEFAQFNLERKDDGSYAYSYSSSDASKQESRSGDGQVQGSYTVRGDDGVQRTTSYTAGAQGFLASGDHLPRTDDGQPAAGTNEGAAAVNAAIQSQRYSTGQSQGQSQRYSAGGAKSSGAYNTGAYNTGAYNTGAYQPSAAYSSGAGSSGIYRSSYTDSVDESPKPFAFNYDAGGHSRQEQADGSGTVRGSYTVNTPDGTYKQLTYQADDSGFHIIDEKQVEGGGGRSGAYAAPVGGAYAAPAGPQAAPYTAGQYKQKSAYYR